MSARLLLDGNHAWAARRTRRDPDCFSRQAGRHQPHSLFIGCSDARVPADRITGSDVGEMFVHRNIANQVVATDNNLLAVVQYAVEVLKVRDIIVCGHEQCGGVGAALEGQAPSHVEGWLAHVRTVARLHEADLASITDIAARRQRLVELNVREQVGNLGRLPVIREAWAAGRPLQLHGWVYGIFDGLLRDLQVSVTGDGTNAGIQETRRAG
jgi:carbonic anhydrase